MPDPSPGPTVRASPLTVGLVLGTSTGGVGRHVADLVEGLADRGVDVRVSGPAATDALFGFSRRGARFSAVEIPAGPHPLVDLRALLALRTALARVDVVHAHGLRAGLLASLAVRPDTPLVVTWHNAVLPGGRARRLWTLLERRVARAADVTLAASDDLARQVRLLGGRDVRPHAVAAPLSPPAGLDREQARALLGVTDRPLVLCIARLHPQKGLDVLLQAAARWEQRADPPVVAVAGDGPLSAQLDAAAASRPGVVMLGRRTDVPDLLGAADVVVLPSRWEARSLVAQEALWAGVPLVATAVGGLPGLLGDAAVLVPPDDPEALAAAVSGLLDDPAAAARLVARGRERAAGWPTPADTVAQVAAVLTELTGRPAGIGL